jgi:hypothetical protein
LLSSDAEKAGGGSEGRGHFVWKLGLKSF